MFYVTVLEGPSAERAVPIMATGDRRVVEAVLREIGKMAEADKLDDHEPTGPALRLVEREPEATR